MRRGGQTPQHGATAALTSELAELSLVPAVMTGRSIDGNVTRRPESHGLDLVVNGQSLRSMTATSGPELVTELNRPWLQVVPEALDTRLGPGDDQTARIPQTSPGWRLLASGPTCAVSRCTDSTPTASDGWFPLPCAWGDKTCVAIDGEDCRAGILTAW